MLSGLMENITGSEVESKVNLNTRSRLKWSGGDSSRRGGINGKCVHVEGYRGVKLSLGCTGQMEKAEMRE